MHLRVAAAACLAAAAAAVAAAAAASAPVRSTRMLDSVIARKQGVVDSGAVSSTLESGILGQAIEAIMLQYPKTASLYAPYLTEVLDTASSRGLTNATFASLRPLDRFSLATAIQWAMRSGVTRVTEQSVQADAAIGASLAMQKKNPDGGLWYFVYPEWSYLDGMFSLLPYMATQDPVDYRGMALQLNLLREHCAHHPSSLLVHGYDWARKAVWADKHTGGSHFVWGRSLGWLMAGLVQTWDALSCVSQTQKGDKLDMCNLLRDVNTQLSSALLNYADPDTGAWWQLVTFPRDKGNYLESSSTALFVFSLLKAVRTRLISRDAQKYKNAALKAYMYAANNFVVDTGNHTIGYNKTVAVCSLNSTATYQYYTKQPLLPNSLLGESAFILASLEVEKLHR